MLWDVYSLLVLLHSHGELALNRKSVLSDVFYKHFQALNLFSSLQKKVIFLGCIQFGITPICILESEGSLLNILLGLEDFLFQFFNPFS
jgi:hypothetical protein